MQAYGAGSTQSAYAKFSKITFPDLSFFTSALEQEEIHVRKKIKVEEASFFESDLTVRGDLYVDGGKIAVTDQYINTTYYLDDLDVDLNPTAQTIAYSAARNARLEYLDANAWINGSPSLSFTDGRNITMVGNQLKIQNPMPFGTIKLEAPNGGGLTMNEFGNIACSNDLGCVKLTVSNWVSIANTLGVGGNITLNNAAGANRQINASYFNAYDTFANDYRARFYHSGVTTYIQNSMPTGNVTFAVNNNVNTTFTPLAIYADYISISQEIRMDGNFGTSTSITQSTPSYLDISKNSFKNTVVKSKANVAATGSSVPTLEVFDDNTIQRGLIFVPNASVGAYNSTTLANDQVISGRRDLDSMAVNLTLWSTPAIGLRLATTNSTNATAVLSCGNAKLTLSTNASTPIIFNRSIKMDAASSAPDRKITNVSSFEVTDGYSLLSPNGIGLPPSTFAYTTVPGAGDIAITNAENFFFTPKIHFKFTATNKTATIDKDLNFTGLETITCQGVTSQTINSQTISSQSLSIQSATGITFSDATVQATAYTNVKDAKLAAIGSFITSTLSASTLVTSGTLFNCGSLVLTAGTYILTMNCGLTVQTGGTPVNFVIVSHSTSSTSIPILTNARIVNVNATWPGGSNEVSTNTSIVTHASTTTYYMMLQVNFTIANSMQFDKTISSFRAVRVA